jgi:hypothetical protein
MADVSFSNEKPPGRPSSPAVSESSSSSDDIDTAHDWVYRQMKRYRAKFVEQLKIRVKVVSWNVNGRRVTEDLHPLLHEDTEPGIYAIG